MNDLSSEQNKKFWAQQAREHKYDIRAVNFDLLEEELELYFMQQYVVDGETVLDAGCGNGRTLINLARTNKKATFYGVDYTQDMIAIANKQKKKTTAENIIFNVGDIISEDIRRMFPCTFDKVITKRCLINLKGDHKYTAVKNIHSLLKPKGIYMMVECFLEPLAKTNEIRKMLGLEEIKVKDFNEYLDFGFLRKISGLFKVVKTIDFGSLYYFTSRVYNAHLSKGSSPDYNAPINRVAVQLTKNGVMGMEGYAPEIMYILEKI